MKTDRDPSRTYDEPGPYADVQRSYANRSESPAGHPRTKGFEGGKDILRIILSIILPPLGVFWQVGFGKHFWINVVLTLFGYLPGIVHALWVIITK